MANVRLASFNVENLFARPAAISADTQAVGNQMLADYREFDTLIGNPTYSVTDRQRMRDLLVALDVYYVNTHGAVRRRFTQTPAWAWLRKNRGSFDIEPTDSTQDVDIIATGRGSWIGWLELVTHAVNEIGTRMTAKVIADIDADILAIIEAEHQPAPNLAVLFDPAGPLRSCYQLPGFDVGERPGTFAPCALDDRLDYILLSTSLVPAFRSGLAFRKGVWCDRKTRPTAWQTYPEMTESVHQASDHSAG